MTTAELSNSNDLVPARKAISCAEIYEEHFEFVWRNARRLGVHESACEDVVQDVFVVVQRRLAEFEGRSTVRTWLWGILERIVHEHRRRHRIRAEREAAAALEMEEAPGRSAVEEMARKEATRLVDEFLAGMDEEKRAVFVLVDLEEVSVVDAARGLGINTNTAYARLRAARASFAEAVKRIHEKAKHDEKASGFWWWRKK